MSVFILQGSWQERSGTCIFYQEEQVVHGYHYSFNYAYKKTFYAMDHRRVSSMNCYVLCKVIPQTNVCDEIYACVQAVSWHAVRPTELFEEACTKVSY
jgi:hypothetical protein